MFLEPIWLLSLPFFLLPGLPRALSALLAPTCLLFADLCCPYAENVPFAVTVLRRDLVKHCKGKLHLWWAAGKVQLSRVLGIGLCEINVETKSPLDDRPVRILGSFSTWDSHGKNRKPKCKIPEAAWFVWFISSASSISKPFKEDHLHKHKSSLTKVNQCVFSMSWSSYERFKHQLCKEGN